MADSKSKKSSNKPDDIESLKSDIATFASSLGLSSSSSGFNDADFRKTGPVPQKQKQVLTDKLTKTQKPNNQNLKANEKPKQDLTDKPTKTQKPNNQNLKANEKPKQDLTDKPTKTHKPNNQNLKANEKPKPKPSVLSLDNSYGKARSFDKFKNMPKLPLMKASGFGVWYEDAKILEAKAVGKEKKVEVRDLGEWKKLVEEKRQLGERLMAQFVQDYESSRGQSGDIRMLAATQRSGTAADKVSAFSILVGDNPIANLRSLDALLGMVASKVGKRHALTGFEALKELFSSSLLPDRKLKSLLQRPVDQLPETKEGYSLLLLWYWEECLKQRYERFVVALEEASRDMLPILKHKALKTVYELLKSKSEQERRLLSALVNKLGDPDNKGASNADYHLANLLSDHPNMKAVVIEEVDAFLFRPHLGLRAKYHAVNFLSQIRLSHRGDGPNVAKRLVDVYFALFKVLITEAGSDEKIDKSGKDTKRIKDGKLKESSESHIELDSRLLSALLTGVNRAFPFVSSSEADDIIEVQTPMLFQLVHSKNFNVGIQALLLLDKISSKNQIISERFYRALYAKLLLPAAMNSSKAEMFIGLLLRTMKSDVNLKRVSAFAKRLMQVALQQPPQFACGCLFLLSEVLKARPPLWNMVLQNEMADEELEHFEDIVEDGDNEPTSVSDKRENNFVKDEAVAKIDGDSSEEDDESPASSDDDGDDFSDEAEEFLVSSDPKGLMKVEAVDGFTGQQPQASSKKSWLPGGYDPRHREPSHCDADRASWWELTALALHVHPSVSTMAKTLLSGANIVYNGNPLNDLSLTAFLDKFMEKKPKSSTWHGGSQIEPAKKLDMNHHLIGQEILSLAEMDVPPEDLVFHKFYTYKMNTSKKPKKKKRKETEDEAADDLVGAADADESDNDEIENMLDSADQYLVADGEYDYDDLDQVTGEDDEDLLHDASDAEVDMLSDVEVDGDQSGDEDIVNVGDAFDEDNASEDDVIDNKKRKRKSGKTGASPFASYEDYEHLLDEDVNTEEEPPRKQQSKKHKSRKKKTSSK